MNIKVNHALNGDRQTFQLSPLFEQRISMSGVDPDWVEQIPGELGNRLTPLGELEWIFTAMMDSIAWSTLPLPLFRKLFRRDLLVAKLFRNFLLADRILRWVFVLLLLLSFF